MNCLVGMFFCNSNYISMPYFKAIFIFNSFDSGVDSVYDEEESEQVIIIIIVVLRQECATSLDSSTHQES